jgi:hypothetical protein
MDDEAGQFICLKWSAGMAMDGQFVGNMQSGAERGHQG